MEKKLGRGLDALLSNNDITNGDINAKNSGSSEVRQGQKVADHSIINIETGRLIPNSHQPRKDFNQDKINELAESIKYYGIIQPIVVKKYGNNYSIVAGERRWRAAKMAGLHHVPVRIIECRDDNVLPMALIENIQRSDLNPIEEAYAIQEIMQNGNYTQDHLAKLVGKSRVYISNALRLLNLPDSVIQFVKEGKLSSGHARALVGVDCAEELAKAAIEEGWSVRQIEESVKEIKKSDLSATNIANDELGCNGEDDEDGDVFREVDSDVEDLTNRISTALNAQTRLRFLKHGAVITINIKNYEQMNNIVSKLIKLGE